MHVRPDPHQVASRKHVRYEYNRRPASYDNKEELHKAQGGSEEMLALTVDIYLRGRLYLCPYIRVTPWQGTCVFGGRC